MLIEGRIGESRGVTGVLEEARLGPYREAIVNDAGLGRYFEATRLGRVFTLSTTSGFTALSATTHLSPLAAATGTPLVGILNPAGSMRAAIIQAAQVTFLANTTTTPLAVAPVWNFIPTPTGITAAGAAGAVRNDLQSTVSSSVMRTFVSAALTGGAAATILRPFYGPCSQVAAEAGGVAATANGIIATFTEETAGAIIVPPGAFLGIAYAASAGTTTQSFLAAMSWVEADWPL